MQEIANQFLTFRNFLQTIAITFVDIVHLLCFMASLILILTSVIADRQGANIGFNAGRWAITAGIVGSLILVARSIFGV